MANNLINHCFTEVHKAAYFITMRFWSCAHKYFTHYKNISNLCLDVNFKKDGAITTDKNEKSFGTGVDGKLKKKIWCKILTFMSLLTLVLLRTSTWYHF